GSKDLGATTLEGSRNGMAMMVYSALHIFGRKGYELLIDRSIDKAKDFAQMIDKAQDFELTTTPILSLLTYRVCPAEVQEKLKHVNAKTRNAINEKVDALVVAVQKQQREAGKSFVSRTRLEAPDYPSQCITVFRVVLANPLTSHNDLAAILAEQHLIAKETQAWKELMDFVRETETVAS
ncbi:MAG: pyridoxal-dependent decarboxylase, partial [Pseudomonadota bacterium]|nr:pyridoxal-dependent decarboxylase [Pseudomonadota bacterium]